MVWTSWQVYLARRFIMGCWAAALARCCRPGPGVRGQPLCIQTSTWRCAVDSQPLQAPAATLQPPPSPSHHHCTAARLGLLGGAETASEWQCRLPGGLHKSKKEETQLLLLRTNHIPCDYAECVVVPSRQVSDLCHRKGHCGGVGKGQCCWREHRCARCWRSSCK